MKNINPSMSAVRLLAAVVTVLLVAMDYFAPPKQLVIHPNPHVNIHAYADIVDGGNSTVEWIDREKYIFECHLKEGADYRFCGASLKFFPKPLPSTITEGDDKHIYPILERRDLSGYDHFLVDLHYKGDAERIRFFVRNAFFKPMDVLELNQQKFIYEQIAHYEANSAVKVKLTEFSVADWWMAQYNRPRQEGVATFDSVMELGFDLPDQNLIGKHEIGVARIIAEGSRFDTEKLYLGILTFWLFLAFFEVGLRLWHQHSLRKEAEHENTDLRQKAHTDVLTQIDNRQGFLSQLAEQQKGRHPPSHVLVIDLDHFKAINDTHGHAAGDAVLVAAADAFRRVVRKDDLLARWGGEEFVIACQLEDSQMEVFINRLRAALKAVSVEYNEQEIVVTMSIGITRIQGSESFETSFERADQGVYAAKEAGRDTWRSA